PDSRQTRQIPAKTGGGTLVPMLGKVLRLLRLPLKSALFDVLVCLGVLSFTVLNPADGLLLRDLALGAAMSAPLLVRRRWPTTVFGVIAALAALQVVLGHAFPPDSAGTYPQYRTAAYPLAFDFAVLIAMYTVVKYSRKLRNAWLAALVVAIGCVVAAQPPTDGWLSFSVFMFIGSAAIWLVGLNYRTRHMYVLSLEDRATTAERERDHLARIAVAEERARIARELHDVVAHSLAVMIVQADGASYAIDRAPGQAKQALKTVADTGRDALGEMRRLLDILRGKDDEDDTTRPAALTAGAGALRQRAVLGEIDALVDRARVAGLAVAASTDGRPPPLPASLELAGYRVVQEGLTNAIKHAGTGARAALKLAYQPGTVEVSLVDDGGGARAPVVPNGGHGLVGMRERVAIYGGE